MILSNPAKFFLILTVFYSISVSCGIWPGSGNSKPAKLVGTEHQPFPTKEPDVYQAAVVIKTGDIEESAFVAKKGASRRYDYDTGDGKKTTVLQTDKTYLIDIEKHVFAEVAVNESDVGYVPDDALTSRLLHVNEFAVFEKLGTENGLTRYQARIGGRNGSYAMIFVDEAIGMPVKQEFYTSGSEGPILQYSVELRNFTTEPDAAVFQLPNGLRKVSESEFALRYRTRN